jgi:uncharacterized membrane protein
VSAARAGFIASLRAGLRGSPPDFIEEVLSDYAAHFEDGARNGRSEDEIAKALGDPLALADELRAESAVSSWESAPTPGAGARVITQAVARGALHASLALLTLPIVGLLALVLSMSGLAAVTGGIWFLFAGPEFELAGGGLTVALGGIGLIAGGISLCALTLLGLRGLITLLARLTRGGFQLIRNPGASS